MTGRKMPKYKRVEIPFASQHSEPPLVSVVMGVDPRFVNSAQRVMADLVNQHMKDFEVIVVLDGDPGPYLVKMWALMLSSSGLRSRLYYTTEKTGVYGEAQRDVGIFVAIGEFLCFLDDDDQVAPWHLQDLTMAARESGMSSCMMIENGRVVPGTVERAMIGTPMVAIERKVGQMFPWAQPDQEEHDYGNDFHYINKCFREIYGYEAAPPDISRTGKVSIMVGTYKGLRPRVGEMATKEGGV